MIDDPTERDNGELTEREERIGRYFFAFRIATLIGVPLAILIAYLTR